MLREEVLNAIADEIVKLLKQGGENVSGGGAFPGLAPESKGQGGRFASILSGRDLPGAEAPVAPRFSSRGTSVVPTVPAPPAAHPQISAAATTALTTIRTFLMNVGFIFYPEHF